MIDHNVYCGDIDQIDERLNHIQSNNYSVFSISADFDSDLEKDFDRYFRDIGDIKFNDLTDGQFKINYLDILDKL